jgi:hypothetical protein
MWTDPIPPFSDPPSMRDLLARDPFSMSHDETRWRMRYEMGLTISDPRAQVTLPDADIDRLPGQLAHLAKQMRDAAPGEPAREAARNFLAASEEYLDRCPPGGGEQ